MFYVLSPMIYIGVNHILEQKWTMQIIMKNNDKAETKSKNKEALEEVWEEQQMLQRTQIEELLLHKEMASASRIFLFFNKYAALDLDKLLSCLEDKEQLENRE